MTQPSIDVIGPYEDDDPTESCSTEHFSSSVTHGPDLHDGHDVPLKDLTTLRIGGPARRLVIARTEEQLVQTVRDCDHRGEPCLILGGGSNIVIGDDGFDGTVVRVDTKGIDAEVSACGGAFATIAAGEVWDEFVMHCIGQEWVGPEALSGIPGLVGSTPIQNVGAYGVEVGQFIARVRTWDRKEDAQRTFTADQCGF
ncbi:FAD-binding protein, partial [Cutibacterium granulosum]